MLFISQVFFYSIVLQFAKSRNELPRLSITNSLDVLRERLLRQIARNKKPVKSFSLIFNRLVFSRK